MTVRNPSWNCADIGGTSGGAISALLDWYGYLIGGPDAARARLERFWDAKCAQLRESIASRIGGPVRMKGSTALRETEAGWQLAQTRLLDVEERTAPDTGATPKAERTTRQRRSAEHKGDGGASLH